MLSCVRFMPVPKRFVPIFKWHVGHSEKSFWRVFYSYPLHSCTSADADVVCVADSRGVEVRRHLVVLREIAVGLGVGAESRCNNADNNEECSGFHHVIRSRM